MRPAKKGPSAYSIARDAYAALGVDTEQPFFYALVDESRQSNHAGISSWKIYNQLNSASIGIEIVNRGFTESPQGRVWYPFPQAQIDQLIPSVNHTPLNPAKMADSRPLYERLAGMDGVVLIEFPFGVPAWDIQYMLGQRVHGKPLINGYSGHVPASHKRLGYLHTPLTFPETEWDTLLSSGATHALGSQS